MQHDGSTFRVDVLESHGSLLVLELSGDLDLNSAERLRRAMAERPDTAALVLDLRNLAFLDSTGLSIVLEAHRRSQGPPAWRFGVIPGPPTVRRVLDISGVSSLLRFVDTPEDVFREPRP